MVPPTSLRREPPPFVTVRIASFERVGMAAHFVWHGCPFSRSIPASPDVVGSVLYAASSA